MITATRIRKPTKKPAPVRHGTCQWASLLPPDIFLLDRGLAHLWVTVTTKAGKVTTLYRLHTHRSASGKLQSVTLTKCREDGPDTDTVYTVDTSFGSNPERHWFCDCPDAKRGSVCKHKNAVAASLRKVNAL